jgi:hypothetical protein
MIMQIVYMLHLRLFKTPPSSEAMALMSHEDSAQLKADCALKMRKGVKYHMTLNNSHIYYHLIIYYFS